MNHQIKLYLGKIIEYHRNVLFAGTKDKQYAKEYFSSRLVQGELITICSPTTYRKLTNDIPVKNEDIYLELLRKLNLTYQSTSIVYKKEFAKSGMQILETYMYGDYDAVASMVTHLLAAFNTDDAYEKELAYVLRMIHEMMRVKHSIVDATQMERVYTLYDIYPQWIQKMLLTAIYNYLIITHQTHKTEDFIDTLQDHPLEQVSRMYYYIDNQVHLDKVDAMYLKLMDVFTKQKNYYRLLEIKEYQLKYNNLLGISNEALIDEIEHMFTTYELPNHARKSYLYFLGKMYNRTASYEKAKMIFEECLRLDPNMMTYILSYYFYCLHKTDSLIQVDPMVYDKLSEQQRAIYTYFTLDPKDYGKREDYILKELACPKIMKMEYMHDLVLKELRKNVRMTKHYVKLEQFLSKIDEF